MSSLSLPSAGPVSGVAGQRAMAAIEARRLARHPVFLVGVVAAFVILGLMIGLDDAPVLVDMLSIPVVPAFFIGLSSLIATARLTRSTDDAAEAVTTAPGSEGRRTAALAAACLVPAAAGLAFVVALAVAGAVKGVGAHDFWFATMPDWQVVSILLALGPVACLGGGLLGVLTGRWLRFPGASAVVVIAVVALCIFGQLPYAYGDYSELRLYVPWAMFHDGDRILLSGNPAFYLGYLLCLCGAATLVAVWHDRAARTARLRGAISAVVIVGLGFLALAMLTGNTDNVTGPVNPYSESSQ